jgi:hypothetical protein
MKGSANKDKPTMVALMFSLPNLPLTKQVESKEASWQCLNTA